MSVLYLSGLKTTEVLIIDGLVEHIGQPLHNLWEKEGGTKQYPPPSLHVSVASNVYN